MEPYLPSLTYPPPTPHNQLTNQPTLPTRHRTHPEIRSLVSWSGEDAQTVPWAITLRFGSILGIPTPIISALALALALAWIEFGWREARWRGKFKRMEINTPRMGDRDSNTYKRYETMMTPSSSPQTQTPTPSSTDPSSTSIPPISSLPSLPVSAQSSVFSALFEPSDALQSLALPLLANRYESYADLIAAVGKQLTSLAQSAVPSDIESLDGILNAHPRLGEKKVDSVRSRAEQASLKEEPAPESSDRLRELNERYERAFPGLRYVYVFFWIRSPGKLPWLI